MKYRPQGLIKAQVLADFIVELSPLMANDDQKQKWTLCIEGLSNNKGNGLRVILEDINGVFVEKSLRFIFKTINNQAEYEALIFGLKLAKELGVQRQIIMGDSLLVIDQVKGKFQAKEP